MHAKRVVRVGQHRRFQFQLIQDLVDELDGTVSKALALNLSWLAQPESGPIDRDRHALG